MLTIGTNNIPARPGRYRSTLRPDAILTIAEIRDGDAYYRYSHWPDAEWDTFPLGNTGWGEITPLDFKYYIELCK